MSSLWVAAHPRARLSLIGEFQLLIDGQGISVPHGVQRLLAFLAVAHRPISRSRVAGQLWPDVAEWRALGNLRSLLWRLRQLPSVARANDERLCLDPAVVLDVAELTELCGQLLGAASRDALQGLPQLVAASEILPGWEDEWLTIEREHFRELRLHALERGCERLMELGDQSAAVQTALAAVEAEPFRESGQRLLVRVHLREGNVAAALHAYLAYRNLVESELGIEPSPLMEELVAVLPHSSR
jgi:DNA-binding SARP family transcriptional activator